MATPGCKLLNNDGCVSSYYLTVEEGAFCCGYVLNDGALSQTDLFNAITMVKDLNIASLISDYVFVFIALCVLVCFGRKEALLFSTVGSFIDICITYSIVGIIDQNN